MNAAPRSSRPAGRRSWEFMAVPVVLVVMGVLLATMLAFAAGLWVWLAVGVVFLVGLVTVALLAMRRAQHPTAASVATLQTRVEDGVHRVLLVADDSCTSDALVGLVAPHLDRGVAFFVAAPALSSRIARWTNDEHAYSEARGHLEATLEALRDLHVDARGEVGSHDPLQAADDGLRKFPADEIVFAVHPPTDANWLEQGVVEAARGRYPVPVSGLTLPGVTG